MIYLTQLIGKTITHLDGERLGKITEVVVRPDEPFPTLAAVQVKTEDSGVFIRTDAIKGLFDNRDCSLKEAFTAIRPYQIHENDFSLVRDVRDRQIVDIHEYRVVRVNDICLDTLPDGRYVLVGVDAGMQGLMRRLGFEGAVRGIAKIFHFAPSEDDIIPWSDVESLPRHNAGEPLKLKIEFAKLSKLHPVDIADVLNQMEPGDRNKVLASLDLETAAIALAEADDEVQVAALQQMDEERAADILEEMGADEAADVLGDMDAAHREDLLGRMDKEEREEVRELLTYDDDTAGGMMTNEFVAVKPDITAQQAIDTLRELEPEAEMIYYVYVVDAAEKLVGVISLRDLIVAKPDTHISEFMISKCRTVQVDADVEQVAHKFERYKLLALPVVDENYVLLGIITIDDTLEQLLPPDWRRKSGAKRSDREREPAGNA